MSPPPRSSTTHDALERALDALERIESENRAQGLAHVKLEHRMDVVEERASKAAQGIGDVGERVAAEERLARQETAGLRQEIAALRLEISKSNSDVAQQLTDIKTTLKIAAAVVGIVGAALAAMVARMIVT